MIRSILLAVDASENAKVARTYANFLAYKLDAVLDAVYVMDARLINTPYWTDYGAVSLPVARFSEEMQQILESQGHVVLKEVTQSAEEAGIKVRTELRKGIPALEILEAAKDCDLIVMGRHGESSKLERARGLGAVAERVVRSSSQPVFIAPDAFQEIKRVLICFDGSDRAREAMSYAVELSRRLALSVHAISVSDDAALAKRRLEVVSNYCEAHEVTPTTQALSGDPADAILETAQEGDLIAMGAFGEGRIRQWLLGSTTEGVLRAAEQPLLLHR
jgi:nucleotide-binding universal stress UspA family protein